ncbi:MAG: ABC transporter permease [Gammaproteobacteria bacterium]|nr:ABC transporter permease [Gammaproteobacteria bacterium]
MRSADLARFAFNSILAARMRSGLTVLGIMVGITAVVLLTAIGEGVRVFVLAQFTQFGTNLLAIVPGKTNTFGASVSSISNVRPLRVEDAEALAQLDHVVAVMPVMQGNAQVEFGSRGRRTVVFGVGSMVPEVWKMRVAVGRFLPPDDYHNARNFAVLGAKMRQELFGNINPLGSRVRIGGDSYRVIGVMDSKGQMLGFDLDDTIYIPVGNALEMFDRESLMEIDVLYETGIASAHIAPHIERLMHSRHGQKDFTIITQDKMLEVLDKVLNVLTLGVAALGGISLVVGAVGILTIMTIAVTERTAEIGLLRAIGARRLHILHMFLGEAIILGSAGGIAGIAAAIGIIRFIELFVPGLPVEIAWRYITLAFGLAVLIGLIAGIAPALRAATLQPLDALRAE